METILILGSVIVALILVGWNENRKAMRLNDELWLERTLHQKLRVQTRSLLWNVAHQREKVHGNLNSLLPLLRDEFAGEEHQDLKFKIIEEVTKNIRHSSLDDLKPYLKRWKAQILNSLDTLYDDRSDKNWKEMHSKLITQKETIENILRRI